MAEEAANEIRQVVPQSSLRIPVSPTPRPGENVVWYAGARRVTGVFHGYTARGKAAVTTDYNNFALPRHPSVIRRQDPFKPKAANWSELPPNAQIVRPLPREQQELDALLRGIAVPGIPYKELFEEIWLRGYEVFLVGGSVRDVLAGMVPKDIDVVTTMPLHLAMPFLQSMYRTLPSMKGETGFLRLGNHRATESNFIDVKMFTEDFVGSPDALFGSSFLHDLAFRDFSCNSLYYDPNNGVLIDPDGRGIADAVKKVLRLVHDPEQGRGKQMGQITIRYVKFRCRGFWATDETHQRIVTHYAQYVNGMTEDDRRNYLHRQLFNKAPAAERSRIVEMFGAMMDDCGLMDLWDHLLRDLC
jgi:hypothetical protein